MEGFRKWVLHGPRVPAPPGDSCSLGEAVWSKLLKKGSDNFSIQIVTPNVAMTSTFCRVAACLPDFGEMWRQGFPVSPQWEGDLELGSDDRNAPGYSDDESGPKKDFVSEVSETSL